MGVANINAEVARVRDWQDSDIKAEFPGDLVGGRIVIGVEHAVEPGAGVRDESGVILHEGANGGIEVGADFAKFGRVCLICEGGQDAGAIVQPWQGALIVIGARGGGSRDNFR